MSSITTLLDNIAASLFRSQLNTNFSNLNTDKAELSGGTFTGDISVPDEAYGVGWNGSLEVPTKNAVYDKIETISGGASTLDSLTDVVIATPTTGQALVYDGTQWENTTLPGGGDALTTNPLSQFASTTSLQLKNTISDETGSGALVFANSPTLVTPALGTPASGTLTNCIDLPLAGLVDINTNRILGRSTAGTGAVEELNVTAIPALIGLGTSDSPQFTGVNVGHATDSTITRVSGGVLAIEGNNIITANITSSTSQAGIVELATTAEINTGTDSTRAMPVDQYVASNRNVRYFDINAIEKATDNAVGTNIAGAFECPFTGTITEIGAYVETAGTTGASVWDVNKNGTTIMTTNKLSIDSAEVSTRTAATAPTLTTTAITAGDLITIDTDSLSTTKPKGLHVRIGIRLT